MTRLSAKSNLSDSKGTSFFTKKAKEIAQAILPFQVPKGIPEWMADYPDFQAQYQKRAIRSRVPIFDIVSKSVH